MREVRISACKYHNSSSSLLKFDTITIAIHLQLPILTNRYTPIPNYSFLSPGDVNFFVEQPTRFEFESSQGDNKSNINWTQNWNYKSVALFQWKTDPVTNQPVQSLHESKGPYWMVWSLPQKYQPFHIRTNPSLPLQFFNWPEKSAEKGVTIPFQFESLARTDKSFKWFHELILCVPFRYLPQYNTRKGLTWPEGTLWRKKVSIS